MTLSDQTYIFDAEYLSLNRGQKKVISAKTKDGLNQVVAVVASREKQGDYDDFIDRFKKQLYLEELIFTIEGRPLIFQNNLKKFTGRIYHINFQIYWEMDLQFKPAAQPAGPQTGQVGKVFFTTHLIRREKYPI